MPYSRFFLTISTNSTDLEMKPRLKQLFSEIVAHLEQYLIFRKVGHDASLIESIKVPGASIEISSKMKYVHLHALIEIKHRSNIQLDSAKVRQKVISSLGVSPHVDNKYVEQSEVERILAYINKGIANNLYKK